MLTVGSCFSGIGGVDLGLERAGMTIRWQIERDPYCQGVLRKHWPDVTLYGDVTEVDTDALERVDLICGGYPCQPFSVAGRRLGSDDPRHLWPDLWRVCRALRPRFIFLENVPGHLSLGFDSVLTDLAEGGYDAEWDHLSAAQFGANHLRWRLWVVAYDPDADRNRLAKRQGERRSVRAEREATARGRTSDDGDDSDSDHWRCKEQPQLDSEAHSGEGSELWDNPLGLGLDAIFWRDNRPPQPVVRPVDDGLPNRVAQIGALGNAVVPQIAEWIGRRIIAPHTAGVQVR